MCSYTGLEQRLPGNTRRKLLGRKAAKFPRQLLDSKKLSQQRPRQVEASKNTFYGEIGMSITTRELETLRQRPGARWYYGLLWPNSPEIRILHNSLYRSFNSGYCVQAWSLGSARLKNRWDAESCATAPVGTETPAFKSLGIARPSAG